MKETQELRTLEVNTDERVLRINGIDYPINNTTNLTVTCEGGLVCLEMEQGFCAELNDKKE